MSRILPSRTMDGKAIKLEPEVAQPSPPDGGEDQLEEKLIIKEITIDGICGVY